jgi:hypothetical protein
MLARWHGRAGTCPTGPRPPSFRAIWGMLRVSPAGAKLTEPGPSSGQRPVSPPVRVLRSRAGELLVAEFKFLALTETRLTVFCFHCRMPTIISSDPIKLGTSLG